MFVPVTLLAFALLQQSAPIQTHSAPAGTQKSSAGKVAPAKAGTSAETNSEQRASAYFERIKHDPVLLREFLLKMPKGGDLHHHLSGSVYAEHYIQWAMDRRLCVNTQTMTIMQKQAVEVPKPDGTGTMLACLDEKSHEPTKEERPIASAVPDSILFRNLVDALSMRNFLGSREVAEYHFFDAFLKFGAVSGTERANMLAEVMHRAGEGNVLYIETLATFDKGAALTLADSTPFDPTDLAGTRDKLLAGGLKDLVPKAIAYINDSEKAAQEKLRCGTPEADVGCKVTLVYQNEAYRAMPPARTFAGLLMGMEIASADARVTAVNLVQPEDAYVSMRDYDLHMRMLDYLHSVYPKVHISLHAGELGYTQVPPEELGRHIPKAIDTGHAERIGHGVDVMYYADADNLLKEMAQKRIAVEINLASNDWILNVKGAQHPLRAYMKAGVPVILCTDDEGVSRSDLTHEYQRAVEEQGLSYTELKR